MYRLLFIFLFASNIFANDINHSKKALKKYEIECKSKNADSCYELANMYRNGKYNLLDEQKAFYLYKKACALKNFKACNYEATAYTGSYFAKKDTAKATKLFKLSCDHGYAKACNNLAKMYSNRSDFNNSIIYYKKACKSIKSACNKLSDIYIDGEMTKPNYKKALYFFKKGCDKTGCNEFAMGKKLHKKACETGDIKNCIVNAKDKTKLAKIYEQACDKNDSIACSKLSYIYLSEKKFDKYVKTLEQACDNDFFYACSMLEVEYRTGNLTGKRDKKKALSLAKKACLGGDTIGCESYGRYYYWKKDYKKAEEIFKQSCSKYSIDCSMYIDMLLKEY